MPPRSSNRKKGRTQGPKYDEETTNAIFETTSTHGTRKKVAGRLAGLTSLPLDVLFEIFQYLHPLDLLRLARLTKDFRRVLMDKSSITVWRTARACIPHLSEPFRGMSEPAWANLVFDTHCHFCLAPNIRSIQWVWRNRVCPKCFKTRVMNSSKLGATPLWNNGDEEFADVVFKMLPNKYDKNINRLFLIEDFERLKTEYFQLAPDKRKPFIKAKKKEVAERAEEDIHGQVFVLMTEQDRRVELHTIRTERRKNIIERLEALGWGPVFEEMSVDDDSMFDDLKVVKAPQPLTDRIWKNIEGPLLRFMEDMKAKQEAIARQHTIRSRTGVACSILNVWKRFSRPEIFTPGAVDFCNFAFIKECIERPGPLEETVSDITEPMFSGFSNNIDTVLEWRSRCVDQVYKKLQDFHEYLCGDEIEEGEPTDMDSRLRLARYPMMCTLCHGPQFQWDHESDSGSSEDSGWEFIFNGGRSHCPLFYPEVLAHRCLTRNKHKDPLQQDDPSRALEFDDGDRCAWNVDHLYVDSIMVGFTKQIIERAGLNRVTATVFDLDKLGLLFVCLTCQADYYQNLYGEDCDRWIAEEVRVHGWRSALAHAWTHHHPSGLHITVDSIDWATVPYSAIQMVEKYRVHDRTFLIDDAVYHCAHCVDLSTERMPGNLGAMFEHLQNTHNIPEPTLDLDYYERLGTSPAFSRINVTLRFDETAAKEFDALLGQPEGWYTGLMAPDSSDAESVEYEH